MANSPFLFESDSATSFAQALAALGKQAPVYYDDYKRTYVLLRHKDIKEAMHDPATYSNTFYRPGPLGTTFIATDGPEHMRQRRMFARAFAPGALKDCAQRIIEPAAREVLAAMLRKREGDLVADFCYPLPMTVISPVVGVSREFLDENMDLINRVGTWNVWVDDPEAKEQGEPAMETLKERLRPTVEALMDRPDATLLGELARAQKEAGGVDLDLLLVIGAGLLIGGYETTTGMMACALSALLSHPEALARVRKDRSLLMPAVEESARWANSAIGVPRRTMRDVEIDGYKIPAGSNVLLSTVAAHYDEAVFPRPEVYDIDRRPEHLLFGGGVHHCVGAPLARLEAKIGLSMLLDALPELALDPARPPLYRMSVRGTVIHGPVELWANYGRGLLLRPDREDGPEELNQVA